MALVVKDRVLETATTTGTGTLTLIGATAGYQSFSSAIGNTNTTYYAIINNSEWEVGLGTVSAGQLSRDSVLESSNGGSLVNFSVGTKQVFCTYPAERAILTDAIGTTVQAYSANLDEYAAVNPTAAGLALLDDADASAQRTTLGLGTLATQNGTFSGTSSGTNTGDQNLFSTIVVAGQSNVVADTTSDSLTLVAGSNVTITTDATTDAITISANDTSVDWSEIQNKPDPVITLAGDLTGSVTLTDLTSGTLTATIAANSVALGTDTTGNYVASMTAGTGITVGTATGEGSTPVITNTAPDQTVVLTAGTGISTSGTYPNFTITNSTPDQTVAISNGTGINVTGTYPNFTVANTDTGSTQNIFKNVAVSGQSTVVADSNNDTLTLVAGANVTITTDATTDTITIASAGGGGGGAVADGDYGDITVSGTGTVWNIDAGVVSTTELGGDITTAGKALLDDADASAQRTTLGLVIGTNVQAYSSVLQNTTASFTTADETKLDGIAAGAEVNVNADWNAISGDAQILNKPTLGTAASTASTDYATAAQGTKADSALQPAAIGVSVQAYDAQLADVAGLTPTDNGVIIGNGTNFVVESGATLKTSLGLTIGTDVQAYDADTAKYDDTTANFTGTLQNGGSNVIVDSDIGSAVQAYDVDTAKLDVAQSWTAQQTFKELKDTVHTITDGAAFEIDPANGSIQTITLGASRTPAATNFEAGQIVLLGIDDGTAYSITWTSVPVTWVKAGGTASAPTLATTGLTWVLLWKVGSTIYGLEVGKP